MSLLNANDIIKPITQVALAIIGNNQIQSKFLRATKITPVAIPAATPSNTP